MTRSSLIENVRDRFLASITKRHAGMRRRRALLGRGVDRPKQMDEARAITDQGVGTGNSPGHSPLEVRSIRSIAPQPSRGRSSCMRTIGVPGRFAPKRARFVTLGIDRVKDTSRAR